MQVETIRQTVVFKADPKEVFSVYMDAKKHAAFTGDKAVIEKKEGGKFAVYGGGLHGWTLELVPGKRIVQAWRCDEEGWPADFYSTVIFTFKKVRGGTQLDFVQHGVPAECVKSISEGWHAYYWEPMKELLTKNQ